MDEHIYQKSEAFVKRLRENDERCPLDQVWPCEESVKSSATEKMREREPKRKASNVARDEVPKLSPQEYKVFSDAIANPCASAADRSARLSMSATTIKRVKAAAIERGLLVEHALDVKGRGKERIALEPTEALLRLFHLELKEYPGYGGYLHRYFQSMLKKKYKAKKASIEFFLAGKRADIGYQDASGPVAVEVELSYYGAENFRKDLDAGFVRVEAYVATDAMRRKIDRALHAEGISKDKASIELLSTVLQ